MGGSATPCTITIRWVSLPHEAQSPKGDCVCHTRHHQQVGLMPHTTQPTGGSDATHYTTNRWVCLPHTTPPTGGSATHNITNRWVWCNTLHHQQVGLMHTTSPTGGSVCRSRWVTLTRHHQYSRTRHHGKQTPLKVIIISKNEGVELTLQEIRQAVFDILYGGCLFLYCHFVIRSIGCGNA